MYAHIIDEFIEDLQKESSQCWWEEQEAWSWSSWSLSLSSSSKGFCLWKMQHFLELFLCMNSLSTVPSFHVTFFFLRLSWRTRVSRCCCCCCCCCCWGWEDGGATAGFSRVTVVVTVTLGDEDVIDRVLALMAVSNQKDWDLRGRGFWLMKNGKYNAIASPLQFQYNCYEGRCCRKDGSQMFVWLLPPSFG